MPYSKNKEFRDPVHGYVSVPESLCAHFIDTAIFQRLRQITQTSMRSLYPSAHHDRFAHSLGVYHLSQIAFRHLVENTTPKILNGVQLGPYEGPFTIAALMHDCAHAPFSHTFEEHYRRNKTQYAKEFLFSLVDEPFKRDYEERKQLLLGEPAQHEIFSAAVFLKHYREAFSRLHRAADAMLVARMITGCTHIDTRTPQHQVENCLVRLINGAAIDVDKLDYIIRDTWASGFNNVSIDIMRLLAALEIVQGPATLVVAFRKSALSVLESVLDGRNFLYRWIYSHHTVSYYDRVLQDALLKLNEIISPADATDAFLKAVFSKEAFEKTIHVGPECSVYLPCDNDIYTWLKAYRGEIPQVDELLCRQPALIPLWKTQAEFEHIFKDKATRSRAIIQSRIPDILMPVIGDDATRVMVLQVQPKYGGIEEKELFVTLLGRCVPLEFVAEQVWQRKEDPTNVTFFYVYIPRQQQPHVDACITAIEKAPY